ncbi:hypothetical protein Lgra_0244 [Legionella gratiana]|uniref:Transposase n=1 Tax=Legionella gratiana TaxID=45066 RepID=A0A378JCK3_9GAMM|nr:hypothetical protein [Legionella gratiana]KTD15578.1 hypothetical protein Lgra_0244 [Legionella gratiana]STX45056.1 Uncharacterised protein [Legionella gratiana]
MVHYIGTLLNTNQSLVISAAKNSPLNGMLMNSKSHLFNKAIFKERFRTIERVFAWEDKFKRLLLRFEHHSLYHYAMKTIAYTMINLRHFLVRNRALSKTLIFLWVVYSQRPTHLK